MILNKIQIGAFGKLENYTLDFSDGFQMIYGDNEDGKTTVMTFLRMMFYGNKSKTARTYRKKYQPWSGRAMGGSVTFTHEGHRYCLEREFRGSDATDRVTLRDLDLGTVESVGPDIGSRFFSMGVGAFERSVFIGQCGGFSADSEAEGELNSRLSNLALTGDEDVSFQTVSSRLEAAQTRLRSPRKVGLYDKGLQQLEELRETLEETDRQNRRKEELTARSLSLKEELTAVKQQYEQVKQTVDREQDFRNAAKLREYLDLKKQLDERAKTTLLENGKPFDELFLGKINFCLSKYRGEGERLNEKTRECETLAEELRRAEESKTAAGEEALKGLDEQLTIAQNQHRLANEKVAETENLERQTAAECERLRDKKKPFHPVFLLLGAVLLAAAVGLWFVSNLAAMGCGAASFVLLLLSFILRPLDKNATLRPERERTALQLELAKQKTAQAELFGKISDLEREKALLIAARNADEAVLREKVQQLEEKKAAVQTAECSLKEQENTLLELFSQLEKVASAQAVEERLPELEKIAEEQKQLKLKLKYLSDDLGHLSYEEAAERLAQLGGEEQNEEAFESARETLNQLTEKGQQLAADLSAVLTELRTAFTNLQNPETIRNEMQHLKEKLQEQAEFYDAANLAQKVLTDSFAELRQGYGGVLEQETLKLFGLLTDGRYQAVSVSPDLSVSVNPQGDFSSRETDLLSTGTADQAYLSLRLALSKLLRQENELPILLDDVLAQYDDKRAERALRVLKEYAADSQVLFFTCHRTLCNVAEQLGTTVLNLK